MGRSNYCLVQAAHGVANLILRIGLTGGLGSGKSTVAGIFEQFGTPVISADQLAREVVAPGTPGLQEIIDHFGNGVISNDGSLDRAAMRQIVFADEKARLKLESIIHPRIRTAIGETCAQSQAPYIIIEIPLLAETGQRDLVDRILVVEAPKQTRIDRVIQRDGLDLTEIETILSAQADDEQRRAIADDVIHNNDGQIELRDKVRQLHEKYLNLAHSRTR